MTYSNLALATVRALCLGALTVLSVPLLGGHAAGQSVPLPDTSLETETSEPKAGAGVEAPRAVQLRASLRAGALGLGGEGMHPYGGGEIGALWGRYGVMALGLFGSGSEFDSILLGGGPALEVADLGFASLSVYAGAGWYQEREARSGTARDFLAGLGAASVRAPVGFGSVGMTATLFRGSSEGGAIESPISATGYRISLGFGI